MSASIPLTEIIELAVDAFGDALERLELSARQNQAEIITLVFKDGTTLDYTHADYRDPDVVRRFLRQHLKDVKRDGFTHRQLSDIYNNAMAMHRREGMN